MSKTSRLPDYEPQGDEEQAAVNEQLRRDTVLVLADHCLLQRLPGDAFLDLVDELDLHVELDAMLVDLGCRAELRELVASWRLARNVTDV